ncbi:MAG: hypothetical protein ABIO71_03485, partial [Caldimonas sp.]
MTPHSDLPAGEADEGAGDVETDAADAAGQRALAAAALPPTVQAPTPRKRPRPGERRVQILETLATMLQEPGAERITTAGLAARL